MTPAPEFSWAEIDALHDSVAIPDDPAPGKSFTVAEYAERYGISAKTAADQLRKLAFAGKLQSGMKGAQLGNRRGSVRCYWVA